MRKLKPRTQVLFTKILGVIALASIVGMPHQAFSQERVYFGNLHSHTSYSDGTATPRDAYRHARDNAKLDFMALTEHNHSQALGSDGRGIATDNSLYNGNQSSSLIRTALQMTENGRFVALYGQEYSVISRGNHTNVFEIPNVITAGNGRFDQLVEFLKRPENMDSAGLPAIVMFNHPAKKGTLDSIEYGLDDFGGDTGLWLRTLGPHVALMQMINGPGQKSGTELQSAGPAETAYRKFLSLGFKIAPTADQDNHKNNWGDATNARTAIVAPELTRAEILKAMRQRHVYATEDRNLSIVIRVNDRLCGDVLPPTQGEARIEFSIKDSDEPNAEYEIEVWRGTVGGGAAKIVTSITHGGGNGTIEDVALSGSPEFFYFRITQTTSDGEDQRIDQAWTAPVWFEDVPQSANPLTGPDAAEVIASFVASRNSKVYHVSDQCLDAKRIKTQNRLTGQDAANGRTRHEDCPRVLR